MTLLLGLVLAGLSALVTQVGFLLRHRGAVAAPDVEMRHPLRSAIALFRSKWWTIGYALAIVAYVLHVGALTLAAMSLVQAVLAGGLVVLAVVAERFFGFELERRQWLGLLLTSLGLAMLAVTGEARSGQESRELFRGRDARVRGRARGHRRGALVSCNRGHAKSHHGILLGISAGLLFTTTHVAVKALSGKIDTSIAEVLLSPYLYIAIAGGIVAFFASARSLQIGPAVPVIAVTAIAGNASAIPAGIIVFGDPLGSDAFTVVVRTMAFLLVVAAAALIPAPVRAAEDPELEPESKPDSEAHARAKLRRDVTVPVEAG